MERVRYILFSPPDHRLLSRSFQAFVLSFAGSIAAVCIALLVGRVLGLLSSIPEAPTRFDATPGDFFAIFVFAPVVETLLLGVLLGVLQLTRWPPAVLAALSGVICGVLHGLVAPLWFFGTFFGFFVFSSAWLTWRSRSLRHAFLAAMLPHALNNLAVFSIAAVPS